MAEGSDPLFVNQRTGQWLPVSSFAANYIRNVRDFGALGNGSNDDSIAIQKAIDDLPDNGGIVFIPDGDYALGSGIVFGNNLNGGNSTKRGIQIWGETFPIFRGGGADGAAPGIGAKLTWHGAQDATMMSDGGAFTGLTIRNLWVDGQQSAGTGLKLAFTGGVTLDNMNISGNRLVGLHSAADFLLAEAIIIGLGDVADAMGVLLDGIPGGATSAYLNTFINLRIFLAPVEKGFGVYLREVDGCLFQSMLVFGQNIASGSIGVAFDYTADIAFPSQNVFIFPDVGWQIPPANQWANVGTPGILTTPNMIVTLGELNGGVYPSGVPNLLTDRDTGELVEDFGFTVSLASGSTENIAEITIGSGEWDVTGSVVFLPDPATTTTLATYSISTTSATHDFTVGGYVYRINDTTGITGSGLFGGETVGPRRISVSVLGSATLYLTGTTVFVTSVMKANGTIRAVRVR